LGLLKPQYGLRGCPGATSVDLAQMSGLGVSGNLVLDQSTTGSNPKAVFGSSTRLAYRPLVTDWPIKKRGIILPLHEMTPNRRVTWQGTSDDENA
jgi:hypothetical protein